jgi:hypothetical protein
MDLVNAVVGKVRWWLRLDGLTLFVASVLLFRFTHQHWWLYPALLFVPDVFILGYLRNTTVGAFFYNLGHSYFAPSTTVLIGWTLGSPMTIAVGIIWLGHVGWDRFFGYGLKYDSHFKHTHLGSLFKDDRGAS